MNYFAHGRRFTHAPYVLAGTATPDWLSVVDRRVRVRRKAALARANDADRIVADVARGVLQHLDDDEWFHRTPAFAALSWRFTASVRDALAGDDGLRPRLLGHILVEVLLDAVLIEAEPGRLDAYYQALAAVDPQQVQRAVNLLAPRPANRLAEFVEHFVRLRILDDYLDDRRLLARLNQVMRRVRLDELPAPFAELLPDLRQQVRDRREELLTP